VVQGGMRSITEATPAAKASPRACQEGSARTNARRAARLVTDTHFEQGAHRKTLFRFIPGFKVMVRL
jgi:hypothetical protein